MFNFVCGHFEHLNGSCFLLTKHINATPVAYILVSQADSNVKRWSVEVTRSKPVMLKAFPKCISCTSNSCVNP